LFNVVNRSKRINPLRNAVSVGFQHFYGKGPHSLWKSGSRAALGIIITGRPNQVNYCVIFLLDKEFTNMAAGRIIQPAGGDWRPMPYTIDRTKAG